MKMIWGRCLLCVAALATVHAGRLVPKTGKVEAGAAPQEEVNVLMFGVLQFGESLRHVYQTTEEKIAKITAALKGHEWTLQELFKNTERAAEQEKQMKDVIQSLQSQMAKQRLQTMMTKDWLAGMEQEEAELRRKVRRLETYLSDAVPGGLRELQERAREHSKMLKVLQLLTQFQKENIKTQNEQLSELQKMSEVMT